MFLESISGFSHDLAFCIARGLAYLFGISFILGYFGLGRFVFEFIKIVTNLLIICKQSIYYSLKFLILIVRLILIKYKTYFLNILLICFRTKIKQL